MPSTIDYEDAPLPTIIYCRDTPLPTILEFKYTPLDKMIKYEGTPLHTKFFYLPTCGFATMYYKKLHICHQFIIINALLNDCDAAPLQKPINWKIHIKTHNKQIKNKHKKHTHTKHNQQTNAQQSACTFKFKPV